MKTISFPFETQIEVSCYVLKKQIIKKFKVALNRYLSEFVYGGIDGIVTTFAVVAAAAGASLGSRIVIIMGIANLIADGISMGVSAYLSRRSEVDSYRKTRKGVVLLLEKQVDKACKLVESHISHYGLRGKQLKEAVETVMDNDGNENVIDFVMKEEYSLAAEPENPRYTGIATAVAFLLVGLVPLIAYITDALLNLKNDNLFTITSILAALAFVGVGALKARITSSSKLVSILETLTLGAIAAGAAYGIGYWLNMVFGV